MACSEVRVYMMQIKYGGDRKITGTVFSHVCTYIANRTSIYANVWRKLYVDPPVTKVNDKRKDEEERVCP